MEYIIDSANLAGIRETIAYFPVAGVTTNPTIITREKAELLPLLTAIREIIGPDRMLHVQVTCEKAEDMLREALALNDLLGPNFYVKIPVTKEGIKAIQLAKQQGLKVTATAIYTQQQALMAAAAGADYVAPYVNKIDGLAGNSAKVVGEIVALFEKHHLRTKVLAASFRNVEQIHQVALAGGHAVTMKPEMFQELISHPATDVAVETFTNDWAGQYGHNIIELLSKKQENYEKTT